MILPLLLACTEPVELTTQVVDAVHGAARPGVRVLFQTEAPRCRRDSVSDEGGQISVRLCPDTHYELLTPADELTVWPPADGLSAELLSSVQVLDTTDALALLGGGSVPLSEAVDVRTVRPKGQDVGLAVPAVLPVALPTWSARQWLFVPDGVDVQAVPVVPLDTLELQEGGPLQPWFALGARVDAKGEVQAVPPANPAGIAEVPGGVVWHGLPGGTYALWDGEAPRVPLLEVE